MLFDNKEINEKVRSLLSKMTLEEKIGQMVYFDWRSGKREDLLKSGKIGTVANVFGAKATNEVQRVAVEESRLGIPLLFGNDVIHGYKTTFPIPLAEACSWDLSLIERTTGAAAREAACAGTRWLYAPMLDIARDPRWGRIYEGAGEDTYLASEIGKARIRGLKNGSSKASGRVISCAKHFAAYGACEGGRDYNTADISDNTLRQVYLPPFKACIDEGVETLMTAFNEINGIPATAHKKLLIDILRNEWGFDGIVVTDYAAITQLMLHGYADNEEEACRQCMDAGVDMDMHSGVYTVYLGKLIRKGVISEESIDKSVYRILYFKYWLGLFENPYADTEAEKATLLCKEHLDAALDSARKSMVLLKNENDLLPLNKNLKKIAVIGPLADDRTSPMGFWNCNGDSSQTVTVLQGVRNKLDDSVEIAYAKGCDVIDGGKAGFAEAVGAAKNSDIAIVVAGESLHMSGEARCRSSLELPGAQTDLIKAVYDTGTPVVCVIISGRPLSVNWPAGNVPAILQAWLAGTRTGDAVADILFGDYNPSGKLTVSFPRSVGQIPVYYNSKNTGKPFDIYSEKYSEFLPDKHKMREDPVQYFNNLAKDLTWDKIPYEAADFTSKYLDVLPIPLFPFGYGLSYTKYEYSQLQLSSPVIGPDESLAVSVKVKNAGKRAGYEIAQLYIRDTAASITRPVRELKGFRKIYLEPGEEKEVEFILGKNELGFFNNDLKFVLEPGNFKVWAGPDSVRGLEGAFTVRG
jgi:beta-glucosidase